jgi:hypothetical protein
MLPLGGAWAGVCRAVPGEQWQPETAEAQRRCNLGYARGICSRFPDDAGPDAIRFTITGDDGPTLRLYYVVERDHHPFAHGAIECSSSPVGLGAPAAEIPILHSQAQAYAASYLRRKSEASGSSTASS